MPVFLVNWSDDLTRPFPLKIRPLRPIPTSSMRFSWANAAIVPAPNRLGKVRRKTRGLLTRYLPPRATLVMAAKRGCKCLSPFKYAQAIAARAATFLHTPPHPSRMSAAVASSRLAANRLPPSTEADKSCSTDQRRPLVSDKFTVRLRRFPFAIGRQLCRFLGRLDDAPIHALRREASEKRQGTKSREVGGGGAAVAMAI